MSTRAFGASLVSPVRPPPRPRSGRKDRVPLPPGVAQRPRTFMRSRFLDNFVLRSAAM
ncbi:hypothetical protein P7K49_036825, partial [Saguinus oedipus]